MMALRLTEKERPVFWAWVAWRDALYRAQLADEAPPPRPPIVTAYIRNRPGGVPAAWWARYQIHRVGLKPAVVPPPVIPPSVIPHVGLATLLQRGVFAAEEPLYAIGLPRGSFVYLTADPNPSYAIFATPSTVAALRSAGIAVSCWGNQSQIGAERIRQLHRDLALDGEPVFQFETADEADSMIAAGARLGVGNGNALRPDQIEKLNALIERGEFAASQESYRNVTGGPWPIASSAGGLDVCSLTVGNYNGAAENPGVGRYISLGEYRANTSGPMWATICSYHARGNREGWAEFPRGPGA